MLLIASTSVGDFLVHLALADRVVGEFAHMVYVRGASCFQIGSHFFDLI